MVESLCVAAVYGAAILLAGAAVASWLTLPASTARSTTPANASGIGQAALWSAAVLCLALLARLVAHTSATFEAVDLRGLRVVAWESRWGHGWRLQLLFAVAALGVAWWHRRRSGPASRVALSLAAVAVCYALPLLGHAAPVYWRIAVAGSHLLAAGGWLGTLAALLLARRRVEAAPEFAQPLVPFRRLSPVALAGAGTAVVTGIVLALLFLGSPRLLLIDPYGRLLAAKLALFAAVCVCGFLNWRAVRSGRSPAAAGWEVALATAIVIVTGFLTETAHP